MNKNTILIGDARRVLRTLPEASVDTVVTSPPYFRLRNYQHDGQIGLERHVDQWVEALEAVLIELQRVLKPTGSLWLNLGDTYGRSEADGAAAKSLVLAPERVAQAMLRNNWIIRNKVIWSKPNPMPTSVGDRLSCTYEVVYFATRSARYHFDLDAVRQPHRSARHGGIKNSTRRAWAVPPSWRAPLAGSNGGLDALKASGLPGHPLGKNPGDVWTIATAGYRGPHHAVYPQALLDVPIKATCPERVCDTCGQPWRRERYRMLGRTAVMGALQPRCACIGAGTKPGIVLDPFIGSGTTAIAAERHGRDWLGIEVNPDFAAQAQARIVAAGLHRQETHRERRRHGRDAADDPVRVTIPATQLPIVLPGDSPEQHVDLQQQAGDQEPHQYGGQSADAQHPPPDIAPAVAEVDSHDGTEHGAEHDAHERTHTAPGSQSERPQPRRRLERRQRPVRQHGPTFGRSVALPEPHHRQQPAAEQHHDRQHHPSHGREPDRGVSHGNFGSLTNDHTALAA